MSTEPWYFNWIVIVCEKKGGVDFHVTNNWKGRGWIKARPQLNGLESVEGEKQKHQFNGKLIFKKIRLSQLS